MGEQVFCNRQSLIFFHCFARTPSGLSSASLCPPVVLDEWLITHLIDFINLGGRTGSKLRTTPPGALQGSVGALVFRPRHFLGQCSFAESGLLALAGRDVSRRRKAPQSRVSTLARSLSPKHRSVNDLARSNSHSGRLTSRSAVAAFSRAGTCAGRVCPKSNKNFFRP